MISIHFMNFDKRYVMRYIITILLLFSTILSATTNRQLTDPQTTMKLIQDIKQDAIVLGNGEIEVHTFIDPLCKMSQKYLNLLYKRNNVLSKYTIYLYLHEIKSKKSKQHILNIMNSDSKNMLLRSIMIDKSGYKLKHISNKKDNDTFNKIAEVANKIGVNKRPYIIINGKVK